MQNPTSICRDSCLGTLINYYRACAADETLIQQGIIIVINSTCARLKLL